MAFDKILGNKDICSTLCSVDYVKETIEKFLGSSYNRVAGLYPDWVIFFVCIWVGLQPDGLLRTRLLRIKYSTDLKRIGKADCKQSNPLFALATFLCAYILQINRQSIETVEHQQAALSSDLQRAHKRKELRWTGFQWRLRCLWWAVLLLLH